MLITAVAQWIDQTNTHFIDQRVCCAGFADAFAGYYPATFLQHAYFVVVDELPKPDLPLLRQQGLGSFIDMPASAITYKNTYYILPHMQQELRLHFHELVHVAQWQQLGARYFIQRYIMELQHNGYSEAPLEKMAYYLDAHYANHKQYEERTDTMDVLDFVATEI